MLPAILVLSAVAVGQWSEPVVLATGLRPYGAGPSLVPHVGDSVWVFWMGQAPSGRCYEADTWCAVETLLQADGGLYWPAGVVDDSGRMLVACYNGDYPTASLAKQDSWGIYAVVRAEAGWSEPTLVQAMLAEAFPTHILLGKDRDGAIGMLWDESSGGIGSMESVMVSRETQSGWTPRCCLAPGIYPSIDCHSGSLVPGDSTDFIVAFSRVTYPDSYQVEVWDMDDSLAGMPSVFAGAQPMLARGESSRFLVLTRGDTLLGAENRGAGWSDPVLIATGIGYGGAVLCADPSGWGWVCWPDSAQQSVLVSYNRGAGWSRPETVVTSGALGSPRIASDGLGNLHCVWFDHTGGGSGELRHARRLVRPGVEESFKPQAARSRLAQTLVRGVLWCGDRGQKTEDRVELLDISGQKVMHLRSGANDVRGLAPGVYFVREALGTGGEGLGKTQKIVVTR